MKSIKHCLAIWMLICFKAHQNLFPCTFFNSKMIRNIFFTEKGNSDCLDIFFKTSMFISAQDKNLENAVGIVNNVMFPPILQGDNFFSCYGKTGFLQNFLFCIGCNGLIHIAPAAGQRPAPAPKRRPRRARVSILGV